jgi:hypothetical protein
VKVTDSAHAFADALSYARSSQHHDKSCVISKRGDLVIVTHANGHRRAFRQETAALLMNRLLADIEVDGFDNLARKGGGR